MRRLKLDRFTGVISAGKEARVYRAIGRDGKEYAVKIYLTATAEFRKSIQKYLLGDPRFQRIDTSSTKKLFMAWARKEYRNLLKMSSVGVRVPKPYLVYQNIVVMEFIGRQGYRAPLLHEIYNELDSEELYSIYEIMVEEYKKIYCCAGLVHADYSEYNIMYLDGEIYIIDVAQAVSTSHPNYLDFLKHDIGNIYRFFTKQAKLKIQNLENLMKEIIGCKIVCPKK